MFNWTMLLCVTEYLYFSIWFKLFPALKYSIDRMRNVFIIHNQFMLNMSTTAKVKYYLKI